MPATLLQQGKGQVLTSRVNSAKKEPRVDTALFLQHQSQDLTISQVKNLDLNQAAQKELYVLFNPTSKYI